MYEELTRNSRWNDRLSALDISDNEFWKALFQSCNEHPSAQQSIATLLKSVLPLPDGSPAQANYVASLPAIPPAVEAFAIHCFVNSISSRGVNIDPVRNEVIKRDLLSPLLRRLQLFLAPCLAVDMNSRSRRGELQGASPEERFVEYNTMLRSGQTVMRSVLGEFGGLAVRVIRLIVTRCDAIAIMLERLQRDQSAVAAAFGFAAADFERVVSISGPLGDPHAHGQGVFAIQFDCGGRVVYKPRGFGLDTALQDLLSWFNERSPRHPLGRLEILDRHDYGWMEHVDYAPCTSTDEIARFYWRQGSYLALLYLLGGRDFYYENVRARGEFPFLVDLECLVSPATPQANAVLVSTEGRRYILESVLASGLLPDFSWAGDDEAGVSLSSLGAVDGQALPMATPQWEGLGRDDLRLVFKADVIRSEEFHLPRLNGVPVPMMPYLRAVISGFVETYDCLHTHRAELASPVGPLCSFSGLRNRVVIRQTKDYQRLLQEAAHPDHLRTAVDLDRFFERLFASLSPRYGARVVQSEIDQLRSLDIPYFSGHTNSHSLSDAYGNVVASEYFPETAIEGMYRRLERFSDADRDRQVRIIERSVLIFEVPSVDTTAASIHKFDGGTTPSGSSSSREERLLGEAASIADRLIDASIADSDTLTWIDLAVDYSGKCSQSCLDLGLYEGAEGIALLLLYLGATTKAARFTSAGERILYGTSLQSLTTITRHRREIGQWVRVCAGSMTFPTSSLYLALHAEVCLQKELLDDDMLDAVADWCESGMSCKPRYDFLSGAAGAIHVLLLAYRAHHNRRCFEVASRLGVMLADSADPLEAGAAWRGNLYGQYVGGYSHGVSGIVPPLLELGLVGSNERLQTIAMQALSYDRSLFAPDLGDWVDQRVPESRQACPFPAWCHGAAGILLSRLQCRSLLPDDHQAFDEDIHRAVPLLLSRDTGSDCLCHGDMGNVDAVLTAGLALGSNDLVVAAQSRLDEVWDASRERGVWRCGLAAHNVAVPGMFLGLAGIAYTLLRFARPEIVPPILTLAAPLAKHGAVAASVASLSSRSMELVR
jgi:type 2 lantibiotic biosynthesis protein LanM